VLVVTHGPFELGPTVAARATKQLGRPVTIGTLTLQVGSSVTVSVRDLAVANAPDASAEPFLKLAKLDGEIAPWSLLGWALLGHGATFRHLAADGVELMMEHGADGQANWHFGGIKRAPNSRPHFPTLLDAAFHDATIRLRTSTGKLLRIRVDQAQIASPAADQPVTLTANGAYNSSPVTLSAALHSFDELHDDATPFGADIHLASGDTVLHFIGSLKQPLDVDGIAGKFALQAPTLDRLLVITGTSGQAELPVDLTADLVRDGALWHMTGAKGTLGGQPFTMDLKLEEGPRKTPDAFTLDAGFAMLDLTRLGGQDKSGAVLLRIDDAPGTRLDAHVTAKQVVDGEVRARNVEFKAKLAPGKLEVAPLTMGFAGGDARLEASIANDDPAGAIGKLGGSLTGADPAEIARLLGLGPLPLTGTVDLRFDLSAIGNTVAEAGRTVSGGLVLGMQGGTISRDLVEQASTDLRTLFRKADGVGRISCLAGVLELKDGIGHLAPLRIRTSEGTILGSGTIDLHRDTMDITIGTDAGSTGFFALDVPVHIGGPLTDPHVLPSASDPDRAGVVPSVLPPAVQELARGNPCVTAGRG
jgi:AsmA family protein